MDGSAHNVYYPKQFLALPERRLLQLSQTDVVASPQHGLQYAAAAYDKGLQPEVAAEDPTAAGEAAAKAMLRLHFLGDHNGETAERWRTRSLEALDIDSPAADQERVATHLLDGRGNAFRLFSSPAGRARRSGRESRYEAAAADAFQVAHAEQAANERNDESVRRHPYAVMLASHHATFEAARPNGRAHAAASLAMSGIVKATRVQREDANAAETSRMQSKIKHAKFVAKHIMLNTTALGLAIGRPLRSFSPAVRERYQAYALKVAGTKQVAYYEPVPGIPLVELL